jgi:hypothetical protein
MARGLAGLMCGAATTSLPRLMIAAALACATGSAPAMATGAQEDPIPPSDAPDRPAEAQSPPPEEPEALSRQGAAAESEADSAVDASLPPPPPPPPPPPSPSRPPPPPPPPPPLAPPPAGSPYARLDVAAQGAVAEFHYVRQDVFQSLAGNNSARVRRMEQIGAYGPFPTGSQVRVRAGDNYLVVPVCDDRLKWSRRALVQVPPQQKGKVTLTCLP